MEKNTTAYEIYFKEMGFEILKKYLKEKNDNSIFILVDENTEKYCLPLFLEKIKMNFAFFTLKIRSGEIYKNLDTCQKLWQKLANFGADRKSLLLNLGGGVITDLGGFVAASYKRGIDFINIPTTLLAMVDASVGSKTGIDFGNLKNQIGFFADPKMVLIDENFIETLPKRQVISGMAEIIKYGLSYDKNFWDYLKKHHLENIAHLIHRSIQIKNEIVLQDKTESHLRKVLNFGHTLGHAVESYFLESKEKPTLTHGEAIAIGMIGACFISQKYSENFSLKEADTIKKFIKNIFGNITMNPSEYPKILDFLKHDKKNIKGEIRFVLIEKIGTYKIDCKISEKDMIAALHYYGT